MKRETRWVLTIELSGKPRHTNSRTCCASAGARPGLDEETGCVSAGAHPGFGEATVYIGRGAVVGQLQQEQPGFELVISLANITFDAGRTCWIEIDIRPTLLGV